MVPIVLWDMEFYCCDFQGPETSRDLLMLQKTEYICLFFMGYEWLNYVGSINKQEYFWLKSLGPNRVDLSWCLSVGDHLFLVSPHPEFIVNAEYLCTSICQPTLWLTFAYETGCLPAVGTWTVMALRELTGSLWTWTWNCIFFIRDILPRVSGSSNPRQSRGSWGSWTARPLCPDGRSSAAFEQQA